MDDRPRGPDPEMMAALDGVVLLVAGGVGVLILAMALVPSLRRDLSRSRRAAEIRKAIKRLGRPT